MHDPLSILKKYWHHDAFRPVQEDIINAILQGKDTLALLPTGGGKSICFQIPGLMKEGLCLVISPLVALMNDQVDRLVQKNIPAVALHAGLRYAEVKKILKEATHGDYQFLYLSPERLESVLFKEYLPALNIGLIVVDEAHCVSQWGYDFRPPYLRIADTRHELPGIPLIALTASATPMVQEDIIRQLQLKHTAIFRQSFARPNLSYSSFKVDSKLNKLVDILNKVPGSAIVYCSSRKQTKEVAHLLVLQKITADFYHAGLSQEERERKQQAWIRNGTRVMVCTNAFGMGIDKTDVRAVIHYNTPDCLENYYQEAGRAGRDGKKAYAVLLYHAEDIRSLRSLPDKRFPPLNWIKKIYQSLADYLNIPVGTGEGNYYDFDLFTFTGNFKLDSFLVVNTLKILSQEGHINFEESIFLPAQVSFTATKENLHAFEQSHTVFEPLIKCLLRTYEGIIDNRVSVFEKQLARLCRTEIETVKQQLIQLQSFGMIEYLPQKETPQIHFLLNRAPAEYLFIDQDRYLQRKNIYEDRVKQMLRYIQTNHECRSRLLADYFGDTSMGDCGICDNCLSKKQKDLSPAQFRELEKQVMDYLKEKSGSLAELQHFLPSHGKKNIDAVLLFLQEEGVLVIDERGFLHKK